MIEADNQPMRAYVINDEIAQRALVDIATLARARAQPAARGEFRLWQRGAVSSGRRASAYGIKPTFPA